MSEEMNLGEPFAYAFFSPSLQKTHPASLFVFSEIASDNTGQEKRSTRRVNILWRGAKMLTCFPEAMPDTKQKLDLLRRQSLDIAVTRTNVEIQYGAVLYRGVFTTENYLFSKLGPHLRVIGPLVSLRDFVDGPIRRVDPPRTAEERFRVRTGFSGSGLIRLES